VKTAFERPDEKRTNPGASTLLREMVRAGVSVHILSGSPTQMRRRLEDKLRLDGISWDSFTLKPNLQNVLRFRFRALRDQLGYKLPALMRSRAEEDAREGAAARETLFGDDAEADAFVYSLYADCVAGVVGLEQVIEICNRGKMYEDVLEGLVRDLSSVRTASVVERILIHLEGQTPPDDFRIYGARVVPFYNYLQAAFVVHEDGRLPADAVLRVGLELVVQHRFDGDALARSYWDLAKRGHLRGSKIAALEEALTGWLAVERAPAAAELTTMVKQLPGHAKDAAAMWRGKDAAAPIDYAGLVSRHNPRKRRRRKR
jgi:hypothetical protein